MTPTPNPTAESVIAEAMVNAGAPLMHSRVEESVAAALRANGLLSEGTPSEAQVERAAKAYLNGGIYTLESDGEHHARMRAALTAAGVAPQEPLALDPEKVAEVEREAAARALLDAVIDFESGEVTDQDIKFSTVEPKGWADVCVHDYSDDAETNDGRVIVWGLQDLKESLDSLVEQQRIANLIAVMAMALQGVGAGEHSKDEYVRLHQKINPQVMEGLGL